MPSSLALLQQCRKLGVQCIVAPYEADAQLAYLSKEGIVDVVVTEDSDLLVFGSKKVFFKMDESGNGKLIELKDLGRANKGLIVRTQLTYMVAIVVAIHFCPLFEKLLYSHGLKYYGYRTACLNK